MRAAIKEHENIAEDLRIQRLDLLEKYGIRFEPNIGSDALTTFIKGDVAGGYSTEGLKDVLPRITDPHDRAKLERGYRRYLLTSNAREIAIRQLGAGTWSDDKNCAETLELLAEKARAVAR